MESRRKVVPDKIDPSKCKFIYNSKTYDEIGIVRGECDVSLGFMSSLFDGSPSKFYEVENFKNMTIKQFFKRRDQFAFECDVYYAFIFNIKNIQKIYRSENIIEIDGKRFAKYRGMASQDVVEDYDLYDGTKKNLFVEGDNTLIPIIENKTIEDIVYDFTNGLRSSMSYLGFRNIEDMRGGLWNNTIQAVRNSPNSMYEGFAHGK
jgi:hypothetical protein